jgi:hypothetical protein
MGNRFPEGAQRVLNPLPAPLPYPCDFLCFAVHDAGREAGAVHRLWVFLIDVWGADVAAVLVLVRSAKNLLDFLLDVRHACGFCLSLRGYCKVERRVEV